MNEFEPRNKMVEENLGLVYMVAKKFSGRGVDFEDIVQIGSVGLIKAAKNFDIGFDVKFSTYAVSMILGEIKRYFRDDGIVKIPRKTKEISIKIRTSIEVLRKKLGTEPTINDLCEYTGIDSETIVESLEATSPVQSIYTQICDDTYVLDTLQSSTEHGVAVEDKLFLKEMLGKLDYRSRQIIILRFFKDKTQQEIGEMFGISQVQVSRLEKKALKLLKEKSACF